MSYRTVEYLNQIRASRRAWPIVWRLRIAKKNFACEENAPTDIGRRSGGVYGQRQIDEVVKMLLERRFALPPSA